MPNCFSLTSRNNPSAGPVSFQKIDEELCRHFGSLVDPKRYYMDWYGIVGFALATGCSFEEQLKKGREWIAANPTDTHAVDFYEVVVWLDNHYISNAWVEIGK